jgi:hypothetical protein
LGVYQIEVIGVFVGSGVTIILYGGNSGDWLCRVLHGGMEVSGS